MTLRDDSPVFHEVTLVGEIDLTNADAHGDLLCRVLDFGAGEILYVDCREVAFLELRGMAMMQRVHRHGVARGTTVRWVGLSDAHRRLLELAGLDGRLHLHDAPAAVDDDQVEGGDQAKAARSSESQKSRKPSWSSPIWWK